VISLYEGERLQIYIPHRFDVAGIADAEFDFSICSAPIRSAVVPIK